MTSWPNIPKGLRRAATRKPSGPVVNEEQFALGYTREAALYEQRTRPHGIVHWRVYGDGREFGRDYPTLEAARQAKARYAANFPHVRYVIRRHRGPALAL